MKFYESQSQIAATPAEVWAVLVDAASWPSWDSGVLGVDGEIALGNKIVIRSSAAPDRTFPVKVTVFQAPGKLVFSNGNFIFKGVRTYTLSPKSGGTLFHMREEYTGAMLGMIWKSMPDLQPSFDQFARGIAKRAEAGASIGG
jgi:uncharacterized protein YndB with AHSA1/START domain